MDIMQEMSTLRVMLDRAVTEAKERGRVLAKCEHDYRGRQSEIHIAAAHRGDACHHPFRPCQGGGTHRPAVHGTGHRPNAVRQQQGSDQQLQIADQDRTGTNTEGVEPGLKAARTRALGISPAVKRKVWARDKEHCIFCQSPYAAPEAHYIRREPRGPWHRTEYFHSVQAVPQKV